MTEEQIRKSLEGIVLPGAKRSITSMNLVRDVAITAKKVKINLASTGLIVGAQSFIKNRVEEVVKELEGVEEVDVEYSEVKAKDLNNIGHIVAVMSGKGGVGKSLVSGLLAIALQREGYSVGILDADITGPSIPRMFGVTNPPAGSESGILPVPSKAGIEIISMNLILPNEDEAVIWRGPLISNAIKQFGEEVLWGNLDYLIIDLPPGTADAPLTVLQTFPISGAVIVFTPQDLVEMIVKKAVNMAHKMEKRVLGIVENMSYLYVPEIDKKVEIFGRSHGEEIAKDVNAPLLAQLPIDPQLAKLCDEGNVESYESEVISQLGQSLLKTIE